MALPFLQEANVDGIIRVLRNTSTIMDDASAEAVRNLHNGLTDAEMNAIISGLNLGGSGGRMISSNADTYIIMDSDASPTPVADHTNFLRILRWQDTTAITNADVLMGSIYWPSGTATDPSNKPADVEMSLGVDTAIMTALGDTSSRSAKLSFGAKYATVWYSHGFVGGGETMGAFDESCLRVHGTEGLCMSTGDYVKPTYFSLSILGSKSGNDQNLPFGAGNYTLGGFVYTLAPGAGFYIGDFLDQASNTDALVFQKTSKGYQCLTNLEDDYEWMNFKSNSADFKYLFSVNADEGSLDRDPVNHGNAPLTVFGRADGTNDPTASIVGISTTQQYGEVFVVRSYDTNSLDRYDLIKAEQRDGGLWNARFTVSNLGNVKADGSYTSPASDVAEWVTTDEQYEYGTVLIVSGDGTFTQSSGAADPKIAGVVAKKPGMEFGRGMGNGEPEGKRPMTVCGITPVKCTTAGGDITAGSLLVSSTAGMAQKAGESPETGTILGKALGTLEQAGEEPVTGEVSCLIILQ